MRQRRIPPIDELDSAWREVLEVLSAQVRDLALPVLSERIGDEVPVTRKIRLKGAVGWMRLPPTIEEEAVELILLAWLAQGRAVPEA